LYQAEFAISSRGAITRTATQHNLNKKSLSKWIQLFASLEANLDINSSKRKLKVNNAKSDQEIFVLQFASDRIEKKLPVTGLEVAIALKREFNQLSEIELSNVRYVPIYMLGKRLIDI
jgi:hypothetical protein